MKQHIGKLLILSSIFLLLLACGQSQAVIEATKEAMQTNVAGTQAANPTAAIGDCPVYIFPY